MIPDDMKLREVAKAGAIPLGGAILTGAGRLPYRGIIHVAGINMFWRASETSIRTSVSSAMRVVDEMRFGSVAFPVIGAGSGGFDEAKAMGFMTDELSGIGSPARAVIVRYPRAA